MANKPKRWTLEEEDVLLRYIKARPQNLHKCFVAVSEQIGRTEAAVSSHWYTVLSKKPDILAFFTASSKHIAKNRKNGPGVPSTENIWKKLLKIIGLA